MAAAEHHRPALAPRRISRVASEPIPARPSTCQPRDSAITPHDNPLVDQVCVLPLQTLQAAQPTTPPCVKLSRLASQHHASEYNRLKFGPNGVSGRSRARKAICVTFEYRLPSSLRAVFATDARPLQGNVRPPNALRGAASMVVPHAESPSYHTGLACRG